MVYMFVDTYYPLVHIDFGFMLSNSPGSVGFESAPFKLSQDYLEILGGAGSPAYAEFRQLFLRGYMALRKHADKILLMVEMMQQGMFFDKRFHVVGGIFSHALTDDARLQVPLLLQQSNRNNSGTPRPFPTHTY